jgi:hypothetical protein
MSNQDEMPEFNESEAASLIGLYTLVGLTYLDSDGNETGRVQMHGIVESASTEGISIALKGTNDGTSWNMPPFLGAFRKANPGSYSLRSTGETIENPDLLCTWAIHSPNPSDPE